MEATQTAAAPVTTTNFVSKLSNDGSMTNEETVEIEILKQHQNQPAIPKATSLLFNSGNIVASERFLLKKKTNTSPQEELHDVLNKTFAAWLSVVDRANVKDLKTVQCRHPEFYERLSDDEKEELSISVKIFLNSFNEQTFNDALQIIMDEIGCKRLDTVILSFPDKIFNEEELPKSTIMPIWAQMQKSIANGKIGTAGLSDFNANYLSQLLSALEDKSQKPTLNQVNITSCCKMPEDLVEFGKINNIQLTTHIDPREILTAEGLQATIRNFAHDYDAHGWLNLWTARYTLIYKCRGVVKSKGYIVNAQRELKYTK
jgi:glutamate--cysteine ligase regulatory subunit